MRETFLNCLVELAKLDPDIFLITGDLGFKVLDPFRILFPDRFLNVGVAEQNLIGVATGLALEGKKVYVYSIANFPTLRCLEQIRNDVCYHDLNVKIVAVGGGFSYGPLGVSHHATEDIAIMRSLPNMSVVAPGSKNECSTITNLINKYKHPLYLRLGRSSEDLDGMINSNYSFGQAIEIKMGSEVAFLCCGGALDLTYKMVKEYKEKDFGIYSFPFVSPIDEFMLKKVVNRYGIIITVEDHSNKSGFGSAILESIASLGLFVNTKIVGFNQETYSCLGKEDFLLDISLKKQIKSIIDR